MKRGIWPSPHDGHLCLLQKICGGKKLKYFVKKLCAMGTKLQPNEAHDTDLYKQAKKGLRLM